MVKTNQFEYLKKVVNVMTYINCSQISCMTFKLLSKIKDIKRFAKSSVRYFLYARVYRGFFFSSFDEYVLEQVWWSSSYQKVLNQHVSSCILFVTPVLDRSVIVDILWYLLWYPLISINIRVDIHCYPHWFLNIALTLSHSRTTSRCAKGKRD